MPTAWLLADTATKGNDYKAIFFWSFVLIVLLLIVFGAFSYFKKWMNASDEPMPTGFTLSDMRELHRQGKMSTEEFEQARTKMVAAAKRMTEKMPDVTPRRPPAAHSESPQGPE